MPSVFARHRRLVLGLLTAMAVANLAAGVVIASWPERQSDLQTMRRWERAWLIDRSNIYVLPEEATDYPPHAIVTFSPLDAVPAAWLVPTWAAVNLGLALLAPFLALRSVRANVTVSETALPVLMFLCWGGFRTLLQFNLLTVTLGLFAMVLAGNRPVWAGFSLGLALAKPQIAVPFFLWALFTRRRREIAVALAVVAAEWGVYCLRVHATPVDIVTRYAAILRMIYTGDAQVAGLSQLRPLIALALSSVSLVDAIAVTIALVMLAVVCVTGLAEQRRNPDVIYSAPALAALWSLVTFYHLTYGFVILLPLAAQLILANEPQSLLLRRRTFWILQAGLMVDIPGLWNRLDPLFAAPAVVQAFLIHFDQLLMLGLFVCVFRLATGPRGAPMRGPLETAPVGPADASARRR